MLPAMLPFGCYVPSSVTLICRRPTTSHNLGLTHHRLMFCLHVRSALGNYGNIRVQHIFSFELPSIGTTAPYLEKSDEKLVNGCAVLKPSRRVSVKLLELMGWNDRHTLKNIVDFTSLRIIEKAITPSVYLVHLEKLGEPAVSLRFLSCEFRLESEKV